MRLVDADPQAGSASMWLAPQWGDAPEKPTLRDVLLEGVSLDAATWPTVIDGLSIVPSDLKAEAFERERTPGADHVLAEASAGAQPVDVEIYDCSPDLGQLTVTALCAASEVILPVRAGGLDMAGVAELVRTLDLVRRRLNPELSVRAVVVCAQLRSNLTEDVTARLTEDFPEAIHASVRHTVRAAEAPFTGQPLPSYAPDATATADYRTLAARLGLVGTETRTETRTEGAS